ncbi:MAG: lipoyl synthase [Nitrospinota bacterium]
MISNRKPKYLIKKFRSASIAEVKKNLRRKNLHTVCESAKCPNIGECFEKKTATFMILGSVCNRSCAFCAVEKGTPLPPDSNEPQNIATMVNELGIRYAVITSVTRDDLEDGGASHFAKTVNAVRRENPGVLVELLIPDFGGDIKALRTVIGANPEILNHNVETVPRLYPKVRPQADFARSLKLLKYASGSGITAKSGIMAGLGETPEELLEVFGRLHDNGVSILTLGQYLAPSRKHAPVAGYYRQEWFDTMAEAARRIGIKKVFAGPLVRSSYMAEEVFNEGVFGKG